jgi:hemoglobin
MDHHETTGGQVVPVASAAVSANPRSASSGCDLDSRSQIHNAVVSFYRELVMDDLLGPVFEEVAEVDWSTHIPLLIDYWCRVLLGHQNYQGTILGAHRRVHELQPLTADLFDRWYGLWVATIDQGWAGPSAEKAKAHAAKIAGSLARQLPQIAWDSSCCPISPGETSGYTEDRLVGARRMISRHPA